MATRALIRFLSACVFLSGAVGLVLEQVFQKYLATLVGASTPAATVVLACYFTGLTVGALACPSRPRRPGLLLGLIEVFVGLWSLTFAATFYGAYDRLAALLPLASDGGFRLAVVRWLIAAVWILPPTIAMGAHLPTLGAVIDAAGEGSGALVRLYAVNLGGAAFATLATPYVLFHEIGLENTLLVAGGVGVVVGAAVLAVLARLAVIRPARPLAAGAEPERLPRGSGWSLPLAGLSGVVFFAFEVIWLHLIAAVLGNSTYSFSLLLGIVLLSLGLGGAELSRADPAGSMTAGRVLMRSLSALLVGIPATALIWPYAGRGLAVLGGGLQSFWAGEALKWLVGSLLIVPVAVPAGLLFPLTLRASAPGGVIAPRDVGRLYSLNAVGCIAGALAAGFVLIPSLGAERSFQALWVLLAASFAGIAWRFRTSSPAPRLVWLGACAGVLLIALGPRWDRLELTSGAGVYFGRYIDERARLLSFHEDHYTGLTTVIERPIQNQVLGSNVTRTLLSNGKFEADDNTQLYAQSMFAVVPSLMARQRGRALVIGLGSGHTAGTLWALGFHELDICDLSPGNIEAARTWFRHINHGVLDRPGVRLHVEDGRNYLLRSPDRFDLVSVEITSVWYSGATNLYSTEFYRQTRSHLAEGGILGQWIQLHHLTEVELATVLGTAAASFKHVDFWLAGNQGLVLASDEPLVLRPRAWEAFQTLPELALERTVVDSLVGGTTLEDLESLRLMGDSAVFAFLARVPHKVNSDRNEWIAFHAPRYYLSKRDHLDENLRLIRRVASEVAGHAGTSP